MRINYNVSALIAQNALKGNDNRLTDSLQRLSSGLKIANAKDNPAGLAMARRMNAQIKSLKTADDNTMDGISIVQTGDGVLSEIQDMIQRMNELAVKASNDTMQEKDRKIVQEEINQLKDEITRISNTTEFNGQQLFDGSFDLRGYATIGGASDPDVKVSTYTDEVATGPAIVDGLTCDYDSTTNTVSNVSVTSVTDAKGNEYNRVSCDGDIIRFANDKGQQIELQINRAMTGEQVDLDITGFGAMAVQIGANEGQWLDMRFPKMNLTNIGIRDVDVTTSEGARIAIDKIKNGMTYVSAARSRLGAYQNRLEHTDNNSDVTVENMTAAYSRIMDVDMAEETTTYASAQILVQAGTSMLAQANQRPSEVLQLLQ